MLPDLVLRSRTRMSQALYKRQPHRMQLQKGNAMFDHPNPFRQAARPRHGRTEIAPRHGGFFALPLAATKLLSGHMRHRPSNRIIFAGIRRQDHASPVKQEKTGGLSFVLSGLRADSFEITGKKQGQAISLPAPQALPTALCARV
jgi:hypothetical protein